MCLELRTRGGGETPPTEKSSVQLVYALDIYGPFSLSRSLSPERRASKHLQRSRPGLIAEQESWSVDSPNKKIELSLSGRWFQFH